MRVLYIVVAYNLWVDLGFRGSSTMITKPITLMMTGLIIITMTDPSSLTVNQHVPFAVKELNIQLTEKFLNISLKICGI